MKLLALAAMVAALVTTAQTAAANEYKLTLGNDAYDYALDGTDVYVVKEKRGKDKHGDTQTVTIIRRSMVDGSSQKVVTFPKGDFISSIAAGGGSVVVTRTVTDDYGNSRPTIERISRDGASRTILGKGDGEGFESSVSWASRRSDLFWECGTLLSLRGVGEDGSVVISSTEVKRKNRICKDEQTVDRWSYALHSPDGTVTPIVSADRVPRVRRVKKGWVARETAPFTQFDIAGDKVAFHSRLAGAPFVFDRKSLATTGPFMTGFSGRIQVSFPSVDPAGRLALTEFRGRHLSDSRARSGVFVDPAAPTIFKAAYPRTALHFCGSHLVAEIPRAIYEIDPVTFAQKKKIASATSATGFDRCDSRGVYVSSGGGGGKTTLLLETFD